MTIDYEKRFWAQVDKQGACWRWMGKTTAKGYGSYYARHGKLTFYRAHKYVWFLTHGPTVGDLWVLHTCDNPWCVNPDHLWLGTNRDNMDDKVAKGRHNHGETHGRAKLTDDLVLEIRASDLPTQEWADRLGVHYTTIMCARNGSKWKHLPMPDPAQTGQTQNE